jgi:hypothetical protein
MNQQLRESLTSLSRFLSLCKRELQVIFAKMKDKYWNYDVMPIADLKEAI